jgi:very-long-chain ceramide synthase
LRHYINLILLYSTLTEFRTVGPFEMDWHAEQYKGWLAQYIAFTLLASLQAVNLFWLFLILRIAKNYVINAVATDERSDNEEEEDVDGMYGENTSVAVVEDGDMVEEVNTKEDAKRRIEGETGMQTDKPAVLVNGKPISGEAHPEGIVERKKNR